MPLCTICTHPQGHEIDLAIIRGEGSQRLIATQFGVTQSAITRHRREHLTEKLRQSQAIATKIEAIDLNRELAETYADVKLYFETCKQWLRDANDNSKFDFSPRAEDVWITYTIDADESRERKKERFSVLLASIEKGLRITVKLAETKYSDPRKLFLEASQQLLDEIHRIGEKLGLFAATRLDPDILESMRGAVGEVQREFAAKFNLKMTWEETIDRVIQYYPNRRAYLEKLREEGPESPKKPGLIPSDHS